MKTIRVGDKVNKVTSIFVAQLMKGRSRLWGVWQTVERIIIKLFGGQKPHAAGGRSHYPVAMGVSPQGASLPLRYRHVSFILSWQYFPNLRPTILINTKVNNLTNLPHTVMFQIGLPSLMPSPVSLVLGSQVKSSLHHLNSCYYSHTMYRFHYSILTRCVAAGPLQLHPLPDSHLLCGFVFS